LKPAYAIPACIAKKFTLAPAEVTYLTEKSADIA
jgi:hypothetical protein